MVPEVKSEPQDTKTIVPIEDDQLPRDGDSLHNEDVCDNSEFDQVKPESGQSNIKSELNESEERLEENNSNSNFELNVKSELDSSQIGSNYSDNSHSTNLNNDESSQLSNLNSSHEIDSRPPLNQLKRSPVQDQNSETRFSNLVNNELNSTEIIEQQTEFKAELIEQSPPTKFISVANVKSEFESDSNPVNGGTSKYNDDGGGDENLALLTNTVNDENQDQPQQPSSQSMES